MEDDILAVINGRNDVRLEVETPELGGLSYRINQLINLFTGVAEEDEEGRAVTSSGGWEAVSITGPEPKARPSGAGPFRPKIPSPQRSRPFQRRSTTLNSSHDYVAAKRSLGEDVSNVPERRFIDRIRGNAEHLAKKHGAQHGALQGGDDRRPGKPEARRDPLALPLHPCDARSA